jgi:hypothetical protein
MGTCQVDFYLKKGDRLPVMQASLMDSRSRPIVIADTTVKFNFKCRKTGMRYSRDAIITDALNGVVEYRWTDEDTIVDGFYDAEFVVTYHGGYQMTFPNDRYLVIEILADI